MIGGDGQCGELLLLAQYDILSLYRWTTSGTVVGSC